MVSHYGKNQLSESEKEGGIVLLCLFDVAKVIVVEVIEPRASLNFRQSEILR